LEKDKKTTPEIGGVCFGTAKLLEQAALEYKERITTKR